MNKKTNTVPFVPSVVDHSHPVDYSKKETPPNYKCHGCGATGCKLWRNYQIFLENQILQCTELLCAKCAAKDQRKNIDNIDAEGRYEYSKECGTTDQIGLFIPAVPTGEKDAYWGYTSMQDAGYKWWVNLPTLPF